MPLRAARAEVMAVYLGDTVMKLQVLIAAALSCTSAFPATAAESVEQAIPDDVQPTVYSYAVNDHVVIVEASRALPSVTYDDEQLTVELTSNTQLNEPVDWTARDDTGEVLFVGEFYPYSEGDRREILALSLQWVRDTDGDGAADSEFVEELWIEIEADKALAARFEDISVGDIVKDVLRVTSWDLAPVGVSGAREDQHSSVIAAVKCGCFRGGGSCKQTQCDSNDGCTGGGTPQGVCMEFDSA